MKQRNRMAKFLIVIGVPLLVLAISFPLIINVCFSHSSNIECLEAKYLPGDLLAYVGAVFAAIGTIFLGIVSLWLEMRVYEESQDAQAKRDLWDKNNTKRPFFIMDSVEYEAGVLLQDDGSYILRRPHGQASDGNVTFRFRNVGDGPAINIKALSGFGFGCFIDDMHNNNVCQVDGIFEVSRSLAAIEKTNEKFVEYFSLVYCNVLGQVYRQVVSIKIAPSKGIDSVDKPYFDGSGYVYCEEVETGHEFTIAPVSYQIEQTVALEK